MIRATLTIEFSDLWGADEFYAEGGEQAIKDMIWEDLGAFVEELKWQSIRPNSAQGMIEQGST